MALVAADVLYERAKYILRLEGWLSLIGRAFSFVLNAFFSYGNYYLYEKELNNASEVEFKPQIPDGTLKVVSSLEELDKLIAEGCDFKMMNIKPTLRKGALAFCVFAGQELAHVTWVAPNEEAKRWVDRLPYKVNFEAGEVCSGASFTDPAYRGRGLLSCAYSYILPHLAKEGILKDKFTIEAGNLASQKAHAKFNPTITGRGRYLRILGWQSWKETPTKGIKP